MHFHKKPAFAVPALLAGLVCASAAYGADASDRPVSLSVRFGAEYTDNRDAIPDHYVRAGVPMDKEDQWSFYIGPTITFQRKIDRQLDFKASYAPVIRWHDNVRSGKAKSSVNHAANLFLEYQAAPSLTLTVKDRYWWSGQKDIWYGDDFTYDPSRDSRISDDYYENRLRVSAKNYFSDVFFAKITGSWRVKRYDADEKARMSDEDQYGARLDLMYVASKHLSYGVFADYVNFDRNSDATKMNGYKIDQGVEYVTTGAQVALDLEGNKNDIVVAQVGYSHAWYEADQLDDQDLVGAASLELRLFQQRDTRVLAGVRYGRDFSDIYPFSSQEDLAGYVSVTQYGFDRKFRATASLELRNRHYDLDDDLDPTAYRYGYAESLKAANGGATEYDRDSVYVNLSATYEFTPYLAGTAYYSYEKIDSDIGTSYTENIFGVNATVKFF